MNNTSEPTKSRRFAGGVVSSVAICGAFILFVVAAEDFGASKRFVDQMVKMSGFIGPGAFFIGYKFPGPFTDWLVTLWRKATQKQ